MTAAAQALTLISAPLKTNIIITIIFCYYYYYSRFYSWQTDWLILPLCASLVVAEMKLA